MAQFFVRTARLLEIKIRKKYKEFISYFSNFPFKLQSVFLLSGKVNFDESDFSLRRYNNQSKWYVLKLDSSETKDPNHSLQTTGIVLIFCSRNNGLFLLDHPLLGRIEPLFYMLF